VGQMWVIRLSTHAYKHLGIRRKGHHRPPRPLRSTHSLSILNHMSATPKLPQAEYRRLGNSGLRVSVPILGCMSFGSKKVTPYALEEEEVSLIHDPLTSPVVSQFPFRRFPC
jgi:hypothetical protein